MNRMERHIRKVFHVAAEGSRTEPMYFRMFNDLNPDVSVRFVRTGRKSDPDRLLEKMQGHLEDNGLDSNEEAWIVADTNSNSDERLFKLHDWQGNDERYGVAIGNPMFEYWLLLHFENGNDMKSFRNCKQRLKRHVPGFKKSTDIGKFIGDSRNEAVITRVAMAMKRARKHDGPQCETWPRTTGTTVYRIVEKILACKPSSRM